MTNGLSDTENRGDMTAATTFIDRPEAQEIMVMEVPIMVGAENVVVLTLRCEVHCFGEFTEQQWNLFCRGQGRLGPIGVGAAEESLEGEFRAVLLHQGRWYALVESRRGAQTRSSAFSTRAEALEDIREHVAFSGKFWADKLQYAWPIEWLQSFGIQIARNGHRRDRVIRAAGQHYVLGPEPTRQQLEDRRYGGLGFGGRQIAFRIHATGERMQSRNCWTSGAIPVEFRTLLPDNADPVESDEDIRSRDAAKAHRERREAQQLERSWKDAALRACRGPAVELAGHRLLVDHEAALREHYARQDQEWVARELAAQWRAEAYRSWRGSWVDLMAYVEELAVQEREEAERWDEMYREACGW